MKKSLYILLSIVVFSSCNEYSLTEGIKPKGSNTKLSAGTAQIKLRSIYSIRFTPYVKSDLGVGKITVTVSNSFNSEKKVVTIEKTYANGFQKCDEFTESSCDFDFIREVNSNRNYLNTPCKITLTAKAETGETWEGSQSVNVNFCSWIYFEI